MVANFFISKTSKLNHFFPPGYTWGHLVYLIDDAIWFGVDSGYAFLNRLTEYKASQ